VGWRFRLEDPRTQQSRCFANATTLLLALLRNLDHVETDHEEASAHENSDIKEGARMNE
jgi:hypothetical protein